MNHTERKEIREKHKTYLDAKHVEWCGWCGFKAPCEVIKVLDYLDVVDPMSEAS